MTRIYERCRHRLTWSRGFLLVDAVAALAKSPPLYDAGSTWRFFPSANFGTYTEGIECCSGVYPRLGRQHFCRPALGRPRV